MAKVNIDHIDDKIEFYSNYTEKDYKIDKAVWEVFLILVPEDEREGLLSLWVRYVNRKDWTDAVKSKLWEASIRPYITQKKLQQFNKKELEQILHDFKKIFGVGAVVKAIKKAVKRKFGKKK